MYHKATKSEAFEEIHKVALDGTSENIASLFQSGNYDAINTTDTSEMVYYVIKFVSEEHNLKDDTTCHGKITSAGELVFKEKYPSYMQEKTKWYWEHK